MKQFFKEFVKRGLVSCWGGPIVLAVIYAILGDAAVLSGGEAAKGILTITMLAFAAAGITAVYQVEKLPLFPAIFIHGVTLYSIYLAVYLINGWLANGTTPLLVFTAIFLITYAAIWLVIYFSTALKTKQINEKIEKTAG